MGERRTAARGRLAVGHVWACARGGIKFGSVYLRDGEGLSAANIAILGEVQRQIECCKGPWVFGGDWNMPPEDLVEWANAVGGVIVATEAPTCCSKSAGSFSKIDFFIVKAELVRVVEEPAVKEEFGIKPHSVVELTLKANPRSLMVRELARVSTFPTERPIGCVEGEHQWGDAIQRCESANTQDELDGAWRLAVDGFEEELILMHGLSGKDADKHRGRAAEPRFPRKPMVGGGRTTSHT